MIDALTPLVLHTVAEAGGPLTLGSLMERLHHSLTDARLRQHIRDLASGGRLRIDTSGTSQPTVSLAAGVLPAPIPPTFPNGTEDFVQRPVLPKRNLPISKRGDAVSRQLTEAATRDGRRPRSSPRRALVLATLDEQPMTVSDLTAVVKISRTAINEHLYELHRSGLVVRYATTRNAVGVAIPIWVSARLRLLLPGPPPIPPRPALLRRKQQREARLVQQQTPHTTEATA